ncbi:efflux RND transporter periplasmic adaptor subunit [Pseudooceanicola sp.]|uniref:efflux RND transporter periplasmic adaptor subunit n=1 Tax=Pseudooceanicola sp. TaxID=1914328 RepID=UPI0035C6BA23
MFKILLTLIKSSQTLLAAFSTLFALALPAVALEPIRCLIEADDLIELSTPVAGIISEVAVGRGDRVEAGQIVARLDSRAEEASLKLAEAQAADTTAIDAARVRLTFLETQAERANTLAARNAVSETVANEAQQEAEIARQSLREAEFNKSLAAIEAERARVQLDQKTLRSPVTGVVTEQLLSPGEYQAGETQIVTVAKLDVLRIEAFAPLDYFEHLALGHQAEILPEPPFDQPHKATITVIDNVFDASTGTFGIRLELPNADFALPAGLRCTVQF